MKPTDCGRRPVRPDLHRPTRIAKAAMSVMSAMSVLLLSLGLAGCSLIPQYVRPDAPVPNAFPGADTSAEGLRAAALMSWQDYFPAPRLKQLIGTALRQNRDLRVAALSIEQARANFDVQRSQLFPALNAQLSSSRQRPSLTGGGVSQIVNANLGFSAWEIDLFGRLRSLDEAALAQFLATEEGRKAVQISLIGAVASGWYAIAADDELLELTRETLNTREESVRLTRLRFDNGVASGLDLQLSTGLAEAARATYAQLQRQRLQDENALAALVGEAIAPDMLPVVPRAKADATPATGSANAIAGATARGKSGGKVGGKTGKKAGMKTPRSKPGTPAGNPTATPVPQLESPGGLIARTPMPALPAGLPSDLLLVRPDIRQAEQQLIAANANIGAARAAFFPRISLTATFGSTSRELSDLFSSGTKSWSFAPLVTQPIFDAGRLQGSLDAAKAQRAIAVAQYEKTIQTAFREVADALAGRATLGEQLRALRAQAASEAERFKLVDLRYRNGVASALDLLDAQRSLFTAQQAALQTRLLQLQNQIVLYKVLGGGWTDEANAGSAAAAGAPATPPATRAAGG